MASMECWPIEIELGGRTYQVPALSAVDWWPIVVGLDLMAILDLIEDPGRDLDDVMLSGEIPYDEMMGALRDTLEAAAGRSLHVAYVLAVTAEQGWMRINGDLIRRGFRWEGMPLGAALDAIYATVMAAFMKQEDLDTWLALLNDESRTMSGKKRTASEEARREFETMAGPPPTTGARSTVARSGSARPRTRTQPRPLRQVGPSGEPMPRP